MADSANYRVALLLPKTRQIVATLIDGTYTLPEITVPLRTRPAEQLTQLIEERWHIRSIVLDVLIEGSPDSPCAVIEVRISTWNPSPVGLLSVDLAKISVGAVYPGERAIIQSILEGEDYVRGPFSRLGWIEEVQRWILDVTNASSDTLTGETLQLNAGGGFCLIRLATSSGTGYWLKATGQPSVREFGITTFLSRACPQYLPKLIGIREDWNAWLMEEHGHSLSDSGTLQDFLHAVRNMAHLQKNLVKDTDALLGLCCGDHRMRALESGITDLIAYLDAAMALQTSAKVRPLSSSRLRELELALRRACALQQELGIPDSLMHSDISPGSILYDGARYVFTDWCEANVGNPFITLEQMCIHATKSISRPQVWLNALRAEYKRCWLDCLTEHQIDLAIRLAPLLSLLSTLHLGNNWQNSPTLYDLNRLSYARSLGRHIDRVVQTPSLAEALCL